MFNFEIKEDGSSELLSSRVSSPRASDTASSAAGADGELPNNPKSMESSWFHGLFDQLMSLFEAPLMLWTSPPEHDDSSPVEAVSNAEGRASREYVKDLPVEPPVAFKSEVSSSSKARSSQSGCTAMDVVLSTKDRLDFACVEIKRGYLRLEQDLEPLSTDMANEEKLRTILLILDQYQRHLMRTRDVGYFL